MALTRAGEEYLLGCGARRVTALVAFDDEVRGRVLGRRRLPAGPRDRSPGPQPVGRDRLRFREGPAGGRAASEPEGFEEYAIGAGPGAFDRGERERTGDAVPGVAGAAPSSRAGLD